MVAACISEGLIQKQDPKHALFAACICWSSNGNIHHHVSMSNTQFQALVPSSQVIRRAVKALRTCSDENGTSLCQHPDQLELQA